MILKQKALQKLVQIMKLKENQDKNEPHPRIEPEFNNSSVCMERNSSTPIPLGHITVDIRSVVTCRRVTHPSTDRARRCLTSERSRASQPHH